MATPLHARTWILLSAGMTAGLATPPPHLTAQAGPGEPGRSLGAWVGEARKSPFHPATRPGTSENPTAPQDVETGTANTREARWRPLPVPDSGVSPGRVFAFTLVGATLPLIPAMHYGASLAWGDEEPSYSGGLVWLASMAGGGLASLVTVPAAAKLAGAESFGRVLAGTVYGAGVASLLAILTNILPDHEFWAAPVFSATMAAYTTVIATAQEK